jgi:hypothetical protein
MAGGPTNSDASAYSRALASVNAVRRKLLDTVNSGAATVVARNYDCGRVKFFGRILLLFFQNWVRFSKSEGVQGAIA